MAGFGMGKNGSPRTGGFGMSKTGGDFSGSDSTDDFDLPSYLEASYNGETLEVFYSDSYERTKALEIDELRSDTSVRTEGDFTGADYQLFLEDVEEALGGLDSFEDDYRFREEVFDL